MEIFQAIRHLSEYGVVISPILRKPQPYIYTPLIRYITNIYNHRMWNTGLPVRLAVLEPHVGRLGVE